MQSHHVIDPKQAGILKVVTDVSDCIFVMAQTGSFGMHGRKSPVLTCGEYWIGRGASCSFTNENLPVSPDVVTLRVQSERKVEVQHLSIARRLVRQRTELRLNTPLSVEMILRDVPVVVSW